jgi:hypothetical protein
MDCNVDFLQIGSCNIAYKRKHIGVTLDSPLLNIEPEFHEAISTNSGNKIIRKVIAGMKMIISAEMQEIDSAFADLVEVDDKTTNIIFGRDVLTTGGGLCLSPISGEDNIYYYFPKTVLIPETVYVYKNTEAHYLKINFEIHEDFEGVFMQKCSK